MGGLLNVWNWSMIYGDFMTADEHFKAQYYVNCILSLSSEFFWFSVQAFYLMKHAEGCVSTGNSTLRRCRLFHQLICCLVVKVYKKTLH